MDKTRFHYDFATMSRKLDFADEVGSSGVQNIIYRVMRKKIKNSLKMNFAK